MTNLPNEWHLLHVHIRGLWPAESWPEVSTYLTYQEAEKQRLAIADVEAAARRLARAQPRPPPPLVLVDTALQIAKDRDREARSPEPAMSGYGAVRNAGAIMRTWWLWRLHAVGSLVKDHHPPSHLQKACPTCLSVYQALLRELPRNTYPERRGQACTIGAPLLQAWRVACTESVSESPRSLPTPAKDPHGLYASVPPEDLERLQALAGNQADLGLFDPGMTE